MTKPGIRRGITILVLAVLTIMYLLAQSKSGYGTLSVDETLEMIKKDSTLVLLDVRTPAEFSSETGHLQRALLIPVQELESRLDELEIHKDKTIIAICRSGNRSGRASALLHEKGFKVFNVEGGMIRWNAKGYPVEKEVR